MRGLLALALCAMLATCHALPTCGDGVPLPCVMGDPKPTGCRGARTPDKFGPSKCCWRPGGGGDCKQWPGTMFCGNWRSKTCSDLSQPMPDANNKLVRTPWREYCTDEKSGDTYCADTTTGVWCCPTDKPVTNKGVKILKKSYAKRYG